MSLDRKILSEINRYKSINNYIIEQEAAAPDLGALAPEAGTATLNQLTWKTTLMLKK